MQSMISLTSEQSSCSHFDCSVAANQSAPALPVSCVHVCRLVTLLLIS